MRRSTLEPRDDIHTTAAYRCHLTGVLIVRALTSARRRTQYP